ncbi:MAG TPA: DUF4760 domain-containing protein [Pyrinomonadaceae bacterium]|nr:DUF4760 domain-containing protein [Pyrinomonadaceae bacterium]
MSRKRVGQLLRLNLSIPLWLVVVSAAVLFLAAYWFARQQREGIKFFGAVVAVAGAIYSAYYVGAALRTRLDRDRQESTFRILDQIEKVEFVEVRNFLEKEVEDHENLSPADLYKKISQNKDLDNAITVVLNIFEKIAIGVRHDVLDEDILYEDLVLVVTKNYSALRGYLEQLRKIRNSPLYYCEFEKLATFWQKGKRLGDGLPFGPLGPASPTDASI